MGGMNAKVRKYVRIQNVGRHSIREESNDNGMRLADLSISRNMVISSMGFPHKHTQRNMDIVGRSKRNEIDHVSIDI
jgi:hypothetical protein